MDRKKVDTFTMQSICIVEVRKKVCTAFEFHAWTLSLKRNVFFFFLFEKWNAKCLNCFGKVDVKN